MMRLLLVNLLLIFSPASLIQKRNTLVWQQGYLLKWSDFKGVSDTLVPYSASSSTGMGIHYTLTDGGQLLKSTVQIQANFYPSYSWYKAKDTTNWVLAHEQNHFDITELHARFLRKAIWEFDFSSASKNELDSIYKAVELARKEMQELFDAETRHSILKIEEKRWEQEVKILLHEWDEWTD